MNQLSGPDVYVHSDGRLNLTDAGVKERVRIGSKGDTVGEGVKGSVGMGLMRGKVGGGTVCEGKSQSTTWYSSTKDTPLPPPHLNLPSPTHLT